MRSLLALAAILSVATAAPAGGTDDSHGTALIRSLHDTIFRRVHQVQQAHKRRLQTHEDICSFIESEMSEMEEVVTCTCSSDEVSVLLNCVPSDDIDPELLSSPEYGSIEDSEATITMYLATGETHTMACATFGGDYYVKHLQGDRLCINMTSIPYPDADFNSTEIEDILNITCEASINDDPCACEICSDFSGFEMFCVVDGNELSVDCAGEITNNQAVEIGGGGDNSFESMMSSIEQAFKVPKFSLRDEAAVDGSSDQSGNGTSGSGGDIVDSIDESSNGNGTDSGGVNKDDSDSSSNIINPANVRLGCPLWLWCLCPLCFSFKHHAVFM